MFYRRILDTLLEWADGAERKPLVLRGARQVGKTTAVRMFGSQFDHFISVNLELRRDRELFERNLEAEELVRALFFSLNIRRGSGRTLLFLDEIQNSPEAVAMMRYFFENTPDLHVIGAGSLLEVMMDARRVSFPVGRVEYRYLHPVTFGEFLQAVGEESALEVWRTVPAPSYAHSRLLELFHEYSRIGGMPEIVRLHAESRAAGGAADLETVYNGLVTSYIDDAGKYARNPSMFLLLRHAIETAPLEAGKRIRFQGFGRSNYRSREMGEALRTLERAMLITLVHPVTSTRLPLVPDLKKSPRLQFIDSGLLAHALGLQAQVFRIRDLSELYQGILVEHVVAQELIGLRSDVPAGLYFWVREQAGSSAEVDFVHPHEGLVVPVEVKSGKTGRLRSLHRFMDEASHPFAVRLWSGGIETVSARTVSGKPFFLLNLPYYLAGRLPAYLDWFLRERG